MTTPPVSRLASNLLCALRWQTFSPVSPVSPIPSAGASSLSLTGLVWARLGSGRENTWEPCWVLPSLRFLYTLLWMRRCGIKELQLRRQTWGIHQYYFSTKSQEMLYVLASFPLFVLSSVARSEAQTHGFMHFRKCINLHLFYNRTPSMVLKVFLNRSRLKWFLNFSSDGL